MCVCVWQGWDKTFCLQFLGKGTSEYDEIHFFGDKTFVVRIGVRSDCLCKALDVILRMKLVVGGGHSCYRMPHFSEY